MIHSLLAAAGGIDLPTSSKVPKLWGSDMVLIIGLATLLFGALITWVVFIRGPRKHPSEKARKTIADAAPKVTETEDGRLRVKKKKRSRRRDHRPLNPTLDQTGGLPPPRDPEQSATI